MNQALLDSSCGSPDVAHQGLQIVARSVQSEQTGQLTNLASHFRDQGGQQSGAHVFRSDERF